MRPLCHITVGAGLGFFVYQTTRSWQVVISSVAIEILMDIDHALDHIIQSNHPFCLRTFLSRRNTLDWFRIVFILHSYEWIVLLIVLAGYFTSPFLWGIVLGMIVHIFLDEIGNRIYISPGHISLGFYFFSYRLLRRFRTDSLVYEDNHKTKVVR